MNIAITGHKGLIGTYLKERLEKKGNETVLAVDLRENRNILSLNDLRLDEKIDLLVHAAAQCKIRESILNPRLSNDNNAEGTFQVLEFCRKKNIPKIIFFSSSRVLYKEKNPYTASKIYGEELCKAYCRCYGIKYAIIRPSTVYGPFPDETKRLMHVFITRALANKDLEIYGNPKTKTLDFTYIDDFIDGTMIAIKYDNEEFNIGNKESNVFELAKFIISKTNSKSKIKMYKEETAQPQQVNVDISKIKKLGYSPKVSLEEGVLRTIDWYKSNWKF